MKDLHWAQRVVTQQFLDQTEVVYASPLKALSNDIHINLTRPLNEISELAKHRQINMFEI